MRTPDTSSYKPRNTISTIIRKELRRFFGDPRMVMSLFLPALMIYVVYSLLGSAMSSRMGTEKDYRFRVYAENLPVSIQTIIETSEAPVAFVKKDEIRTEDLKEAVSEGEIDLLALFPADFDEKVPTYDPNSFTAAPAVELYYDSSEPHSAGAFSFFSNVLNTYESLFTNRFDVNRDLDTKYDLASPKDFTSMLFSTLMPMLLMMFMISGCMMVAPESIAGEKERGTIATLLVTPMKRSHLAIGKITALSVISLLSGICSFFGVLLALPKLMGEMGDGMFDSTLYTPADYLCILAVLLPTVLFFVSCVSVLSAMAKSIKEATSFIGPLTIVVALVGMSGMFTEGAATQSALYLIPVYNTAQCLSGIFSMAYNPMHILITALSNIAFAGLLVFILTRLFNSEKVMFKK